jgi:glycosyltransferase involved in cell wall biosynthesis
VPKESDVDVSVVIPTVGRETLRQAVDSVLAQEPAPLEVLVVFDLAEVPALQLPGGVRSLCTGGGRGGNAARRLGVDNARGTAVAFLDDDDYWYPGKLAAQVAAFGTARERGLRPVISARLDYVDQDGTPRYSGPTWLIAPGQSVPDYLFKRRRVRDGGANLCSSSLLIDRTLLTEVPLDSELGVHEDWDWLVRAGRAPNVHFESVPGKQLAYRLPAQGKRMSRSAKWRQSLAWAEAQRGFFTAREYGDFLLTVTTALAVDSGSRSRGWLVLVRALVHGRPGLNALAVAGGLLVLPRQSTQRIWVWVNRVAGLVGRQI